TATYHGSATARHTRAPTTTGIHFLPRYSGEGSGLGFESANCERPAVTIFFHVPQATNGPTVAKKAIGPFAKNAKPIATPALTQPSQYRRSNRAIAMNMFAVVTQNISGTSVIATCAYRMKR